MATLFGLYPFLLKLYADGGYQGPIFRRALKSGPRGVSGRGIAGEKDYRQCRARESALRRGQSTRFLYQRVPPAG